MEALIFSGTGIILPYKCIQTRSFTHTEEGPMVEIAVKGGLGGGSFSPLSTRGREFGGEATGGERRRTVRGFLQFLEKKRQGQVEGDAVCLPPREEAIFTDNGFTTLFYTLLCRLTTRWKPQYSWIACVRDGREAYTDHAIYHDQAPQCTPTSTLHVHI